MLSLFISILSPLLFGQSATSGIYLTTDKAVGCQYYGSEEVYNGPYEGADVIGTAFLENIDPSICIKVCENSQVIYNLTGDLQNVSNIIWTVIGGTTPNTAGTQCNVLWGLAGSGSIKYSYVKLINGNPQNFIKTICVEKIVIPTANFTVVNGDPNNTGTLKSCVNQTINFMNLSTPNSPSAIINYHWDFGDGTISFLENPTHIYSTDSIYKVTLVVTNSCNCGSTVFEQKIAIEKDGFEITCPGVVCANQSVTYHLPANLSNHNCTPYNWSVQGGTLQVNQNNGDATVNWNQTGQSGFGYITFNPSSCGGSCKSPLTTKIPVITTTASIIGSTNICVGEQERYKLPQWPSTDFTWEIIAGGATILNTDQRNEIILRAEGSLPIKLKVTYRNTLLQCGGVALLDIRVNNKIPFTGDELLCKNDTGHYVAANGYNVDWTLSLNGDLVEFIDSISTFDYNFTTAGTYELAISGDA